MKHKLLVLIHIRSNELINISIILILLWNRGLGWDFEIKGNLNSANYLYLLLTKVGTAL
jgi:hypothetical protein